MRVTKIVRDYVEKTIIAKMPYGEPTAQYKAARARMDDLHETLNERLLAIADEMVKTANLELPEGFKLYVQRDSLIARSDYEAPLKIAANAHEVEVRENRKKVIEAILVELELGATKADLERLIAAAVGE